MKPLPEMIAVMTAAMDKKPIDSCIVLNQHGEYSEWRRDSNPVWNWQSCDYRVSPGPRKRWVRECNQWGGHFTHSNAELKTACEQCEVFTVTEDQP